MCKCSSGRDTCKGFPKRTVHVLHRYVGLLVLWHHYVQSGSPRLLELYHHFFRRLSILHNPHEGRRYGIAIKAPLPTDPVLMKEHLGVRITLRNRDLYWYHEHHFCRLVFNSEMGAIGDENSKSLSQTAKMSWMYVVIYSIFFLFFVSCYEIDIV